MRASKTLNGVLATVLCLVAVSCICQLGVPAGTEGGGSASAKITMIFAELRYRDDEAIRTKSMGTGARPTDPRFHTELEQRVHAKLLPYGEEAIRFWVDEMRTDASGWVDRRPPIPEIRVMANLIADSPELTQKTRLDFFRTCSKFSLEFGNFHVDADSTITNATLIIHSAAGSDGPYVFECYLAIDGGAPHKIGLQDPFHGDQDVFVDAFEFEGPLFVRYPLQGIDVNEDDEHELKLYLRVVRIGSTDVSHLDCWFETNTVITTLPVQKFGRRKD